MSGKTYPEKRWVEPVRPVPTGPLSERMERVLVALLQDGATEARTYGMTGNEIGHALGFSQGDVKANGPGTGRGNGPRSMGAAQKIIGCVIGLERRGLVRMASRKDKRTGTAYRLTTLGEQEARRLMGETAVRTDFDTAGSDDTGVWGMPGYVAEQVDPIRKADVSFAPGQKVTMPETHELYPDEEVTIQGVGEGKGMYAGGPVYDVLAEGSDETTRMTEREMEE